MNNEYNLGVRPVTGRAPGLRDAINETRNIIEECQTLLMQIESSFEGIAPAPTGTANNPAMLPITPAAVQSVEGARQIRNRLSALLERL